MSRIIAVVACGLTVAACSMPSLDFLKSSPQTEVVRFQSEPPGAEVKTSSGQSCRTPCELTIQAAPEISAEFALKGYQPQTVSARSEASQWLSSPHLVPNPVYAELRPISVASSEKRIKKKPAVAAGRANSPVASAAPAAPPPVSAAESTSTEATAPATNSPWPDSPRVKQ